MKAIDKNQRAADRLDAMNLSQRARDMIAQTSFQILDELFGQMDEEAIEEMAREQEEEEE